MDISKKFKQSIELLVGDITTLDVEAIVNPTDAHMTMVGGLSPKIKSVGGQELIDEVEKLRGDLTKLNLGDVLVSTGGNLPAKKVFHALLPPLQRRETIFEINPADVFNIMEKILNLAKTEGLKSIAIPELGTTGVFGLDPKVSAESMLNALTNFFSEEELPMKTIIVLSKKELFEPFKTQLEDHQIALRKPEEIAQEFKTQIEEIFQQEGAKVVPMNEIVQKLQLSSPLNLADLLLEHPIPEYDFDWDRKVIKRVTKRR